MRAQSVLSVSFESHARPPGLTVLPQGVDGENKVERLCPVKQSRLTLLFFGPKFSLLGFAPKFSLSPVSLMSDVVLFLGLEMGCKCEMSIMTLLSDLVRLPPKTGRAFSVNWTTGPGNFLREFRQLAKVKSFLSDDYHSQITHDLNTTLSDVDGRNLHSRTETDPSV